MSDLSPEALAKGDLAARLEAASEGSRELSDEVLLALGWRKWEKADFVWIPPGADETSNRCVADKVPDPTKSVDDGLALAVDLTAETRNLVWHDILQEATTRLIEDAIDNGLDRMSLKRLPLFISAALVRAAQIQKGGGAT